MSNLINPIRGAMLAAIVLRGMPEIAVQGATFGEDAAFMQKHTSLVILSDGTGGAKIAVAPAWQGRVMTSTANGDAGISFGWINRDLIASGKTGPHINIWGGEDRFWMGPEGGQFSVFFAKGAKFELKDWQTPAPIDTMAYELKKQTKSSATFAARFSLTNYSGTEFDVKLNRQVKLLSNKAALASLGIKNAKGINVVAYESVNKVTNAGKQPWDKQSGLLSIWILGMFAPSDSTTVAVPIKSGPESQLGVKVTSDYFGQVPPDRLVVKDDAVYFSGDGQCRSKIGISPLRSKGVLGSYDAANNVLTIVKFTQPEGVTDYVNSLWKLQDKPYGGDASNSYNDGPATPGAKPFGPFYELESSSPAAALAPGKSLTHTHTTIHLTGPEEALDVAARATLGLPLAGIKSALMK